MNTEPQVTYVPPAARVFHQLARDACQRLFDAYGTAAFRDPETVRGLGDYLSYIAELTAKYLNKGYYELLDNSEG